jgi:hypothetical protein
LYIGNSPTPATSIDDVLSQALFCPNEAARSIHYVFGFNPSTRINLSNIHIDGKSPYTTGCGDGYYYWTVEMVGKGDQISMKSNYITRTAGRSPALS